MMKVILYMAMSVNGYIAQEDGDTPWSENEWKSFSQKIKLIGNLIVGRRAYEIMKNHGEFEKIGNPLAVVVTHKPLQNKENIFFVKTPGDSLELLKGKGFTSALVGGGGKLNASFMKKNLVDEIYLDVEPVVLGKGVKLFDDGEFEKSLELLVIKKISKDEIQLHYKVKK